MDFFKNFEEKLKNTSKWIANEAGNERWDLVMLFPQNPRRLQISDDEVSFFLSLTDSFSKLTTIEEKLSFKDTHLDKFEFHCHIFALEKERKEVFRFNFLPFKDVQGGFEYFNRWFIRRSQELLIGTTYPPVKGIPYITLEELKAKFNQSASNVPILEEFANQEMERVRALCNQFFPKMFDRIYDYKIKGWGPTLDKVILTKAFWPDLVVTPYVEYYIKLKKYLIDLKRTPLFEQNNKSKINPSSNSPISPIGEQNLSNAFVENSHLSQNPTYSKMQPKDKDIITFLNLFKNEAGILEDFMRILRKHHILFNGKWHEGVNRGLKVPLIKLLEDEGIIWRLKNNTQKAKLFNETLGGEMSIRNYAQYKKKLELDSELIADLKKLNNKPK